MSPRPPVEHLREQERHNVTVISSGGQNMKFMFGLQHPLTCKPWTTLSNPCNKVRGKYICKEVFLRLSACVCLYYWVVMIRQMSIQQIYQNCPERFRTFHRPSSGVACMYKAWWTLKFTICQKWFMRFLQRLERKARSFLLVQENVPHHNIVESSKNKTEFNSVSISFFSNLNSFADKFLNGIIDSRKAGSLWGMMRGVGGVRKSTHHS